MRHIYIYRERETEGEIEARTKFWKNIVNSCLISSTNIDITQSSSRLILSGAWPFMRVELLTC